MKSRKILSRNDAETSKIITGDKLKEGEYAILVNTGRHDGRVVTPKEQFSAKNPFKLVMLTAGATNVGDSFGEPSAIQIRKISEVDAKKLIKKSDAFLKEKKRIENLWPEC